MNGETAGRDPDRRLDVFWSIAGQVRPIVVIAVFGCLYVLGWATGVIAAWLAVAGIIVFGVIAALGIRSLVTSRSAGRLLGLDLSGITVGPTAPVPWTDIAVVRVTGLQPRWLFFLGRRRVPIVAFVGQPGVRMPRLPHSGPQFRWSRTMTTSLYGTDLVVMTSATTTTPAELLDAVADLSDVPVDDRLSRPARRMGASR